MVNLYRVPSEFSICRMRDSLMRQFVDQDGGGENDENQETEQKTLKKKEVSVLFDEHHKSTSETKLKKDGLSTLIRFL